MGQTIIRAAGAPVRMAGGVVGFLADWAWLGAASLMAFGGALLGERLLTLVFG